ncbi:MAG: anthranilate phosphoribosyltransferase [Terriglobia bacterium]
MILECLKKALQPEGLTAEEAAEAMEEILAGQATPTQTAALLVALAMKGETEDELWGMARVLRGKTYLFSQYGPVEVGLSNSERRLLQPEGFSPGGAEPAATFNISSAVAFVVAGAGAHVLQQGYRSADNELDSAGVLEALGINTRIHPAKIAQCVAEAGLGFVFEPVISETMERLLFAFREIPVPTAFHLLLPLLNPGGAPALVIGVHSAAMTEPVARVAARMGVRRAFVVHGTDGLDEITNTEATRLVELRDGKIYSYLIEPGDFEFPVVDLEDLAGGDAQVCAEQVRAVLQGEASARRDVVLLNAAPGIVCAGKARTLVEGIRMAEQSIDSGRALRVLESVARLSQGN